MFFLSGVVAKVAPSVGATSSNGMWRVINQINSNESRQAIKCEKESKQANYREREKISKQLFVLLTVHWKKITKLTVRCVDGWIWVRNGAKWNEDKNSKRMEIIWSLDVGVIERSSLHVRSTISWRSFNVDDDGNRLAKKEFLDHQRSLHCEFWLD